MSEWTFSYNHINVSCQIKRLIKKIKRRVCRDSKGAGLEGNISNMQDNNWKIRTYKIQKHWQYTACNRTQYEWNEEVSYKEMSLYNCITWNFFSTWPLCQYFCFVLKSSFDHDLILKQIWDNVEARPTRSESSKQKKITCAPPVHHLKLASCGVFFVIEKWLLSFWTTSF